MNPEEKIPVRIPIGNKLLPLRVARKNEEYTRLAGRMINNRMDAFKMFESTEEIDRLAWAALDFTTELVRIRSNEKIVDENIDKELAEIEDLLSGY